MTHLMEKNVSSGNATHPNTNLNRLTKLGQKSIIVGNTPAMPLSDAHFGGFFMSGVCR